MSISVVSYCFQSGSIIAAHTKDVALKQMNSIASKQHISTQTSKT